MSDDADVLRLFALAAGADVELDGLAFLEGAVAGALDRREVHEHVGPVLTGDEAVALLRVEPFHTACSQRLAPLQVHVREAPRRRPAIVVDDGSSLPDGVRLTRDHGN